MATPTLSADLWVNDDLTVSVSGQSHMAVVTFRHGSHVLLSLYADTGVESDRRADLTLLRGLAQRMLDACDHAIDQLPADTDTEAEVVDRPKPTAVDLMANLEASLTAAREAQARS